MTVPAAGARAAPLGLIAGRGRLPLEIARAARRRGLRVAAVALRRHADPAIEQAVDEVEWLGIGELEGLIRFFHRAGVREAVMAGKVPKTELYPPGRSGPFDRRARELLERLADRRDDSLLGALAEVLAREQVVLRPQAEMVPELLPGEGPLGRIAPSGAQHADILFGWPLARSLAALGIGQTLVVQNRAVLAVEAIEGTDAAICRGGELGGGGACVLKVAGPDPDLRFDLPAIGPDTLTALVAAGAGVLAFEAHRTVVLERAAVIEVADAAGLALVGVAEPPRELS